MLGGIVRGKRTSLRVPTEADLDGFARWAADVRVRGALTHAYWDEPAARATWKERLAKQSEAKDSALWAIEAEGALVGSCRVEFPLVPTDAGMSISHFTIDPERWGQGLGWDAALALHRWIFDIVYVRYVAVTLAAHNAAALRIAERLGYETYARGRAAFYGDGRYVDELQLRMDLAAWDERWSATEREYPQPLGEELEA
jgi:RimJ/RimL family protein N-acetyltransferase